MQTSVQRYFVAIARRGSLRSAAEDLHIAQSALSRQLQNLEAFVGASLFERHARGVTLTPAGEIFFRYAKDSLTQLEEVRAEIGALKTSLRGEVRVCSIASVANEFLSFTIGQFIEQHPEVTFSVRVEETERVIEAVRDGEVEIGFGLYPQVGDKFITGLRIRQPIIALMSSGFPLAQAETLSVRDLVGHRIALPMKNSGSRMLIDVACRQADIYLTPSLQTHSIHLLMHFVKQSDALALLTRPMSNPDLNSGNLVAIPMGEALLNSATADAVVLKNRHLPTAAAEFLRFLEVQHASLYGADAGQPALAAGPTLS
jgi:DNA-binding transcriptional LysR family regulator